MGLGRNGPIDQSQKKPKICKDKERGEEQWLRFGLPNHHDDKNSVFLAEDFVDVMKRMDPQQLANILLPKEM